MWRGTYACGRCAKPNPPNRLNCLYCENSRVFRDSRCHSLQTGEIENWEPGVNIVATAVARGGFRAIAAAVAIEADLSGLPQLTSASYFELPEEADEGRDSVVQLGLSVGGSRMSRLACRSRLRC